MWILISIGLLAIILVLFWLYVMRSGKKPIEPMSAGMALGGIIGAIAGILLVEFAGFEYPVPAILWMLGMAAGEIIGLLYKKRTGA